MNASLRPELRLVLAVSIDGRLAAAGGGPAAIGGPGDRRALEEGLAWGDGALVGAQTLRLHGATCLIHAPDLLEARRAAGRSPQPIAIVVSRSGAFPATLPFFSQPLERWLLRLPQAPQGEADHRPAGGEAESPPPGFQQLLPLGSWESALADLARRGVGRLVVLGGAALAGSLMEAGVIDELQLTLCPRLLGGSHGWLSPDSVVAPPLQEGWRLLERRDLGDQELLLRYRRSGLAAERDV